MPIRPIDTLSMPTRSQEASQVRHNEEVKATHTQEQSALQFQSAIVHNTQQTVKMEKSENKEYRYKDGKKNKGNQGGSSEHSGDKKEKEEKKVSIRTSSFDITI